MLIGAASAIRIMVCPIHARSRLQELVELLVGLARPDHQRGYRGHGNLNIVLDQLPHLSPLSTPRTRRATCYAKCPC